jgi:2-dehydro-3-deoxyphosphooctonate aldolase (KDO 8-P synthase)
MNNVPVKDFFIGEKEPLAIISGPCVIESEEHCMRSAETLKKMFERHGVRLIFKSSYDKANRSAGASFRGPGLQEGLRILQRVQNELELPVITDIHTPEEAIAAGEVCDIIQIPAFLCRQTDLVLAAARTGATINVKKGQFLAPWDMKNVIDKIVQEGNHRIILTDRGSSFGYNNLVSDMRAIPIMKKLGYPVCYDATHSVQKPGGLGDKSGGDREFIPHLTLAALGAGVNCLFIESHPNPSEAKSDSSTVMDFKELDRLLPLFKKIYTVIQNQ